jgi:hypothetical protein
LATLMMRSKLDFPVGVLGPRTTNIVTLPVVISEGFEINSYCHFHDLVLLFGVKRLC